MAVKIDSNVTGLRFAEETTLGVLPGSPVWYPLEPNKYTDFGGKLSTMVRRPLSQSRQLKKGTVTDLEASGGFSQDLTQKNSTRLLQGFLFADIREKETTAPMNDAQVVITSVDGTNEQYVAASGLGSFLVNALVLASNFGVASNNGLRKVSGAAATTLTVTPGLTVESTPPATAKVETVGYEFATATADIDMVGGLPRLIRASGAFDFTTLGLIPGEWVYLGADDAGNSFANNVGFARVNAVAASYIEFDKVDWTPVDEVGTGKAIRLYFGSVLKNEADPDLVVRRTYQLERTLGNDTDGVMSEYLVGASANEMTIDMKQADKITIDMSFVATDNEQRDGDTDVKTGTRPDLVESEAFNTSSDFSRIQLSVVDPTTATPSPLFAYGTELSISVKNNVSANKALGVLGAIDATAGLFEVSGKMTVYFADVAAVQAVRNNTDATLDICIAKHNAGFVFDLPLISLGDGRLKIEQDKAIDLPLEVNAATSKFDHTLLINVFAYLPTVAE